jgi:hypothetical protein
VRNTRRTVRAKLIHEPVLFSISRRPIARAPQRDEILLPDQRYAMPIADINRINARLTVPLMLALASPSRASLIRGGEPQVQNPSCGGIARKVKQAARRTGRARSQRLAIASRYRWRLRKHYLNCRPGSGRRGEKGAIVQEERIGLPRAIRSMTRSATNDHRDSL